MQQLKAYSCNNTTEALMIGVAIVHLVLGNDTYSFK